MTSAPLRLGVAGLGRAFTLMIPTFRADPRVRLVAGADPRPDPRRRFAQDFDARTYDSVEGLCADPDVQVVYVASPHQHHAEHVLYAARAGKHVLVEKPVALSIPEAQRMIEAAERAGTALVVGHSHSFDRPIQRARELVASGAFGGLHMITAMNFTDFMYRPRRPEELDTSAGGGVLFGQAAHQVDIVRLLGGGMVRSVRAHAGAWDRARRTEGAYAALLAFEDGAYASLTYSGYAHYDSDELMGWTGEMGFAKDAAHHARARRALAASRNSADEARIKAARNYGGALYGSGVATAAPLHQHFGFVLASCERADLRPLPTGVMIYGDEAARLEALEAPAVARSEVIDELCAAVLSKAAPLHDGRWALATLEACLAMLQSAREGREIMLQHQVAADAAARVR